MKTTRNLTLAVALASIFAITMASSAWAQRPGGDRGPGQRGQGGDRMDPAQMFERADANKDGKITKEEFQGPDFVFDRMDADGDGVVTKQEAENMRQSRQRPEGDTAQRGPGGDRGQGGFGGGFDRSRFEQMMMDRYKEALESSDEEWKVIEPRIKKVTEAQRATRIGGRGGMMGRGGRGGEETDEPTEAANLRKAIDTGSAEDIKGALKEFRTARKKAEAELKQAQTELRQVLTLKQEARLVMMGTLD